MFPSLDVAIAYSHPGTITAEFADSLLKVYSKFHIRSRIALQSGPRIAHSRNRMARAFLDETEAEWLWMLDSDMCFEPDVLPGLLACGKPVVGGLTFSWSSVNEKATPVLVNKKLERFKNYPKDKLVKVTATGAACLLINREVLQKIEIEHQDNPYTWFEDTVRDGKEYGEDVEFCLRAAECGFPIFVHTGLKCGHVKGRVVGEAEFLG